MASVNQQQQIQPAPDWTNASRGTDRPQPNRSYEALFEGLGNVVSMTANAVDTYVKSDIENSLYAQVDPIRNAQGVDTAVQGTQAGASPLFPSPQQAVPQGAARGIETASRLKQAYDQGAINETAYWARLEATSRQLRQRYPGYREEIDQRMSSITGSIPANALRRSILSDLEQQANEARAASSRDETFIRNNIGKANAATREKWAKDPSSVSANQVAVEAGNREAYDAEISRARAVIGLKKDQNSLTSDEAERDYTREVNGETNRFVYELNDYMVANGISIQQLQNKGTSPEQDIAIRNMFSQFRQNLATKITEIGNSPLGPGSSNTWATAINDPTKIKNINEQALAHIQAIEDAYFNKDYGAVQANINIAASVTNSDVRQAMGSNAVRTVGVLTKVAGPEAVARLDMVNGILSEAAKAVGTMALGTMTSQTTSAVAQIERLKQGGVQDPKEFQAFFNDSLKLLTDPSVDIAGRANLAWNLFNADNNNLLTQIAPKDRAALYSQLTSKPVTDAMLQVRDKVPQTYGMYVNWAGRSFGALFKQEASDLQNAIVYNRDTTVKYDPNTAQFSETDTKSKTPVNNPSINKINAGLRNLKYIVDNNGGVGSETIPQLIQDIGIDTSADKQNSLGSKIYGAVAEVAKTMAANLEGGEAKTANVYQGSVIEAARAGFNNAGPAPEAPPETFNEVWMTTPQTGIPATNVKASSIPVQNPQVAPPNSWTNTPIPQTGSFR